MSQVRTAEDPTKAILSKSGLDGKYLCDYVINVATGCRHGCQFCYVPGTPNIRTRGAMLNEHADVEDYQSEWGDYVLYRDHLPAELPGKVERKRVWECSDAGLGVVGLSFHTDCFMDRRAADLAVQAVRILTDRGHHVRVLTRAPLNAATMPIRRDPAGRVVMRGTDALANAGDRLTVGASINSLDSEHVAAIERRAPPIEARLAGLQRLADAGVQVYVSMSPTYPTMGRADLRALLERLAGLEPAVVFHEPINPRGKNYNMTVRAARQAGQDDLADALKSITGASAWADYAVSHFRQVQELGAELDLPVHLWPDKDLLNHVDDDHRRWLQAWRDRQPPEDFAGRQLPEGDMPALPARRAALNEWEVSG